MAGQWGSRLKVLGLVVLGGAIGAGLNAELAPEAYNISVSAGNYGVLGVKTSSSPSLTLLAGLGPTVLQEVEGYVTQGQALVGRSHAVFDARVVGKDIEFITGLTLEQIGGLLLQLAAAHDEGRFDLVYEQLAVQESLGQVFGRMTVHYSPRVKAFVRETALEFRRRALAQGLVSPQQLEPQGWLLAALIPLVIDLCVAMLGSFLYDLSAPYFGLQVVTTDQRILVELGKLRQDVEIIKELALWQTNIAAIHREVTRLNIARGLDAISALDDLEASPRVATRAQLAEFVHAFRELLADVPQDDHLRRRKYLDQLVDCALYLKEIHLERSGWKLQGVFSQGDVCAPNLSHPVGIVLAKDRTTMRDERTNFQFDIVDVAIVQLHRQESVSQADLPRIRAFVDEALHHLGSTYWSRTVTNKEATLPALEIVGVVFSGESESGAALARELAEGLERPFACRSEGIVLITWEENGDTQWDCIGASCNFYLRHPELLRALVEQLTPRTRERPPAQQEYRPGSRSCVTVGGWNWHDDPGGMPIPMRYGN